MSQKPTLEQLKRHIALDKPKSSLRIAKDREHSLITLGYNQALYDHAPPSFFSEDNGVTLETLGHIIEGQMKALGFSESDSRGWSPPPPGTTIVKRGEGK